MHVNFSVLRNGPCVAGLGLGAVPRPAGTSVSMGQLGHSVRCKASKSGQVVYRCSECGETAMQWSGQCMSCKGWSTLEKTAVALPSVGTGGGGGARAAARFSRTSDAVYNNPGEGRIKSANPPVSRGGSWVVDSLDGPRSVRDIAKKVSGPGVSLSNFRLELPGDNGSEFSRVLGGGIVPGSLVLVGGEPGVGKSTLLLQVADMLAKRKSPGDSSHSRDEAASPILYVSGEESVEQIGSRAARMNMDTNDDVYLYSSTRLDVILDEVARLNPSALIIDSIQTIYLDDLPSSAGSVVQVRECASALLQVAKRTNIPVFLVGHVTKSGDIAGPRVLEHIVDVVLYMEGGRQQQMRLVRCVKNRYGPTDEVGVFSMEQEGMCAVSNPSAFFLSSQINSPSICSATTVVMEGTRPLMMEVQALCSRSHAGSNAPPMRVPSGVKKERLWLILAVLSKYTRIKPFGVDIHVNVTGGLNVTEPCADLAIACAIGSSYYERPLPIDTAVIGEIGLGGELRPVVQLERRVLEAQKLGFQRIIVPKSSEKLRSSKMDIEVVKCDTVESAFDAVFGRIRRRSKKLKALEMDETERYDESGEDSDHYL
jgi:DNA repair protein RadA/Sms